MFFFGHPNLLKLGWVCRSSYRFREVMLIPIASWIVPISCRLLASFSTLDQGELLDYEHQTCFRLSIKVLIIQLENVR